MAANPEDIRPAVERQRSIPELIKEFTHEITALMRDEVSLAKGEVSENIARMGNGLIWIGLGGLVLFAGLLVLLDAAVAWLLLVLPPDNPWAAPLIVGAIVFVIGAIMLAGGRGKVKAERLKPTRTLDESRRDRRMIREKLS